MSTQAKTSTQALFEILGHQLFSNELPDFIHMWLDERWYFPQHRVARHAQDIHLYYLEQSPFFPSECEPELLNLQDLQLECRQHQSLYYLGTKEAGSSLDPESYTLKVWGKGTNSLMSLQVCLAEILRLSNYLPLHASVIAQANKATAFSAPSGTGKTTTLLKAFEAGYDVIAEDFIWVNPNTLQVFTWDKGVRLLPDTYEAFKHLLPNDFEGKKDAMNKVFVPYEVLGVHSQSEVFLENLVWLNRDLGQASVWSTVSKREAAMKLWEAAGIPFTTSAKKQLNALLPKVLRGVQLKSLSLGNTAIF